jgi:endonuclease/exonuclease/phosphatase family metal-dependent hydrolase
VGAQPPDLRGRELHLLPDSAGLPAPPAATTRALKALDAGLDADVPAKAKGNLLIGTWNLRQFSRITKRWRPTPTDNPKRNLQDLCCMAEVISRFDVCALVELKNNLEALRLLMQALGPDWSFVVSDTVEGHPGNYERLGFAFDQRRIRLSGLVGEVVIPDEELRTANAIMRRQFVRTPYCVSFRAGERGFTLVTLHIIWGKPTERTPELRRIAKWFADHAQDPDDFNRNMIALGDFNIDRLGDPNWKAFVVDYGLSPPDKLLDVPRTVGESKSKHTFYDQIAWFTKGKGSALTLTYKDAGGFIWSDYLLKNVKNKEARISDHYPLWTEFSLASG